MARSALHPAAVCARLGCLRGGSMGWCCTRLQAVDCEGCGCSGRAAAVLPVLRAAKRLRQGARRCAVPDGVRAAYAASERLREDQEAVAASCPAGVPCWASTAVSSVETARCSALGRNSGDTEIPGTQNSGDTILNRPGEPQNSGDTILNRPGEPELIG